MSGPMLEVTDLVCGYGDIVAVDNLSFTVGAGEIFGLVGANGAGKSATIMALAGLLPVRSGTVRLGGRDITAVPAHARIDRLETSSRPAGRRARARSVRRSAADGCPPAPCARRSAPARTAASSTPRP